MTCPPSGVGRGCGTHAGGARRHRHWFRAPARADRRSAFPCLRLVRQSGEASCAGLRPARADRRSAFPCLRLVRQSGEASCAGFGPRVPREVGVPCLRLVRQSGEASCAGLRPARADRMSAFPCLCLVRQSGDASCAGLRPARCRPEVGVPLPASREGEQRCAVRWPPARACRPPPGDWPEVGGPSRPRASARAAVRGFAALSGCGAGLETGGPLPTGDPEPHRRSPGRSTKSNQLGPLPLRGLGPGRGDHPVGGHEVPRCDPLHVGRRRRVPRLDQVGPARSSGSSRNGGRPGKRAPGGCRGTPPIRRGAVYAHAQAPRSRSAPRADRRRLPTAPARRPRGHRPSPRAPPG